MTHVDALVVGGAAAGLSAALVLGRARVDTLVVDAGEPSNRHAGAIGGLLGQDGTSPAELYALGREQLAAHPAVRLRAGAVTAVAHGEDGHPFTATLADGATVTARRILLAGGMTYAVPAVPGLDELWGHEAFACPYCHGWEHRDKRIALLGAEGLEHRLVLLRGWSADLVAVPGAPLPAPEAAALREAGVPADERPIASVAPGVVRFADGDELACDAIHVVAPLSPRDDLAAQLGLATRDQPNGVGFVTADAFGATSHPQVFAAGDLTGANNVAAAIAAGNLAATGLHRSLLL